MNSVKSILVDNFESLSDNHKKGMLYMVTHC